MPFWLGPLGNLQRLPNPLVGADAPLIRKGAVYDLPNGGTVIDTFGYRRQYQLSWRMLAATVGVLDVLEGLRLGRWGTGVLVALDPLRINLLPTGVSLSTSPTSTTTGFVASVGALTSVVGPATVGARCLRWAPGTLAAAASVRAPDPIVTLGVPVVSGLSYAASVAARLDTGSPAASARAELRWYDAAGTLLSTTQGSTSALSTSAWTTLSVAATPPAGAVLVGMALQTPTTGVAPLFLADQWQLQLGTSATPWQVGTGCPRVLIDQMPESYPQRGRHDITMILLEV